MKFSALSVLFASLLTAGVLAAPAGSTEFSKNVASGLRFVSLAEHEEPVWKTEDQILDLIKEGARFIDYTDTWEKDGALIQSLRDGTKLRARATFPAPSHQTQVRSLISTLSLTNMQNNLSQLTALNNRYYKSTTGATASTTIYNILTSAANGASGVTISYFTHSSFSQKSVIARIDGSTSGPLTILGAHLDSINQSSPSSGRAPGADDDGTGVVNLIEAFRALVASGFKPTTPIEFHFYAGEEGGLLGSSAIASNYVSAGKSIKAMFQLDMTAYFKPGTQEIIAIVDDYVDAGLNTFVRQLISAYNSLPAGNDHCGYACSDHASWYNRGIPTTYPFEATTANSNPNIHTSSDTTSLSGFSWSHCFEFTKLALAFAYELGA